MLYYWTFWVILKVGGNETFAIVNMDDCAIIADMLPKELLHGLRFELRYDIRLRNLDSLSDYLLSYGRINSYIFHWNFIVDITL